MPCSSEGYPPSPMDYTELGKVIMIVESAEKKIKELKKKLGTCKKENRKLRKQIEILRNAMKLVGNGS